MNTPFVSWLQSVLTDREISQAELARRSGLSRAAISNILGGMRNPGNEVCSAIAKGLNIPEDEVFIQAGLMSQKPAYSLFARTIMNYEGDLDDNDKADVIALIEQKASRRKRTPRIIE